jgi:hypothetical protein
LKWEGYLVANAHILPQTARSFDAFHIQHDEPCKLGFYGLRDAAHLLPRIDKPGCYELTYLVVADNFPPVRKTFTLSLKRPFGAVTLVA